MFRRLAIFLFLAVIISSCNLPVIMERGGGEPPLEEALSNLAATYIAGTVVAPLQATDVPPTPTPIPTETSAQAQVSGDVVPDFRYTVQQGTPLGITNFLHPEAGCNWLGVGGQAFKLTSEPALGLIAVVGGSLAGTTLNNSTVSGSASGLGPGGFEIALSSSPVESQGTVWIQLFDANGNSQSDRIFIDTYADCNRNLILVNFTEVPNFRTTHYLPLVGKERLYYYLPIVGKGPRYDTFFPFVGKR
jgi:hypothetical protein